MERVIREIQRKIREHRGLYMANEEAVKHHLILPILETLGWRIDDPEEVRPEEKTSEGRADYALVKNDKVVAYIEVKNLSINVIKAIPQLAKYCFDSGVEVGIVTNGKEWMIIRAFEPGKDIKERIIMRIDVEEEALDRIVLKFKGLSKDLIEKAIHFYDSLRKINEGVRELKDLGISENEISKYVISLPLKRAVDPEDVEISDLVRGVYIFDGVWKFLPNTERSLKGSLVTVLEYFKERVDEKERKIIDGAIREIKVRNLEREKIIALLKGIEREKGVRILLML
ncbi:hypothetical protein PNA2_0639 [Pyrococcus sp. NA2]|uniref:type I restriction endonuclease n=1 Tax=Pyrococcus sp. (strain NA2) TaxID=342949 RepID=UPI000209AC9C|nr:type I restriction endonuclease [Pyrococcus sp. NA2]AEC51554.1 hypothetical protein PNA2_0639 [Pyrococcus sp. NA2]